ncbi:MAG: cobalamin-dependent protein [Kofleriaceae bacterium]|nr:cobalamin-dependent protein [Kofleriaceae bacterium]
MELHARFLRSILAGDLAGALAIAREARAHSLPFFYEEIVARSLAEVGRRWEIGEISIADEHVATAVAQSVIASFYPSFPWAPEGPKGVVACPSGERHELGARIAADLLANDGWNVLFVGADVPEDALLALVARERPRLVGLSIALPERLPRLRETIAQLRKLAPAPKLLVGGRAVSSIASADLGVDAVAISAADVVALTQGWKS